MAKAPFVLVRLPQAKGREGGPFIKVEGSMVSRAQVLEGEGGGNWLVHIPEDDLAVASPAYPT